MTPGLAHPQLQVCPHHSRRQHVHPDTLGGQVSSQCTAQRLNGAVDCCCLCGVAAGLDGVATGNKGDGASTADVGGTCAEQEVQEEGGQTFKRRVGNREILPGMIKQADKVLGWHAGVAAGRDGVATAHAGDGTSNMGHLEAARDKEGGRTTQQHD